MSDMDDMGEERESAGFLGSMKAQQAAFVRKRGVRI